MLKSFSIPAGHIFGVQLRIHWTFLVLLALVLLKEVEAGTAPDPARDLGLAAIFAFSVLLHELGHALVAKLIGAPLRACMLLPIGGIHVLEADPADEGVKLAEPEGGLSAWRRELYLTFSGPLVNFAAGTGIATLLFALGESASALWPPVVHSTQLLHSAMWVNLGLAFVNLIPAFPTDAGHLLRSWFAKGKGPQANLLTATRRAVTVGQAIAMTSMLGGIVSNNIWLALFGFSVFIGAKLEERSVIFHAVLESVRLEEVMLTDFATLAPSDTLEDAFERAVHTLQDDFPVVRESAMVGVVSRHSIMVALREEGNSYVQSVMDRFYEVANRKETLAWAFRKLASRQHTLIPVLEVRNDTENGELQQQRLVGIVTLQNLMHSMALLAESKKLKQGE